MARYKINNFIPLEDKYFNKKSIANNEDIKVVINPTIRGKIVKLDNTLKEKMNSDNAAKEMAGIPKRKENFAASFLSHPDKSAVEIVTPDLETPGNIANAWAKPIEKVSMKL